MNFLPNDHLFDLYYGQPASGKSEAVARLIEQMYRETGKKARLVIGDGSLMTYRHLLDAGIAESVSFQARSWPTSVLNKLVSGWWPSPADRTQRESGAVLQPPVADEIKDTVGIYVFEGISTAAAYMIGNIKGGCAWNAARGNKIGQDAPYRVIDAELDPKTGQPVAGSGEVDKWGGTAPSHYLYVQTNLPGFILQSSAFACHVIWTAHESTNDPEKSQLVKEQIVGPEVIGKALTDKIQRIFQNTVHMQSVANELNKTMNSRAEKWMIWISNIEHTRVITSIPTAQFSHAIRDAQEVSMRKNLHNISWGPTLEKRFWSIIRRCTKSHWRNGPHS